MGATFPNGIAAFTTKKNMVDDVEASDVNKLQDEVVAIEEVLGDALTTLEILEEEITELADEEASDDAASRSRDRNLRIKYNNLKEMIQAIWWGKNFYVAAAQKLDFKIPNTPAQRPYPPNLIKLEKPPTGNDPSGMWNGTGFTLKKSGFYFIHGMIDVNLAYTGPTSNKNFGTYEGSITFNGVNWIQAIDRQYPVVDKNWHNVVLHPSYMGWLDKGTRVTLRAAQSSDLDQNVHRARLALFMLRAR